MCCWNSSFIFTSFNNLCKTFLFKVLINYGPSDESWDTFVAGYMNTTSAVDAIQFKCEDGTFSGTIKNVWSFLMSDQASTIMVNTLEPQSGTTLTGG